MPQGLQVFDAAGVLVQDITDRLPRIIYKAIVTADGSVTDPAFSVGSLYYSVLANNGGSATSLAVGRPNISKSGSTVTWTYPAAFAGIPCLLVLGVY